MRYTLAAVIAFLFAVQPVQAFEIVMTKPPGHSTKALCLSTNGKPAYANLATVEQQLRRVVEVIDKHTDHYDIDLSYSGTKSDCGTGGEGEIAVNWADTVYVYQHPINYTGHQSMRYTTDGTPAVFVQVKDVIVMNTADGALQAVMANPERLCVALLEQVLHAFGLGHEFDVPSITNENDSARTCALTPDDIAGLALLYPLDGESDLHCALISDGSSIHIDAIAYQGYWYRATISINPGTQVWPVTHAQYWNAPPYPGCEGRLSFDGDLAVYGVPVLVRKSGYDGAMYRLTFSLDVSEMSINVISSALISDVGFGVGVEAP